MDRDRLQGREPVQRLEAFLAPVPAVLDAAERQLDTAARAVVVDEDLTALNLPRQPHLPAAVAGPYAGHQAVGSAVCEAQRVRLVDEGLHHQDRTENFLLD